MHCVSDILKDLNPEQKEAVTTTEGPLLIIAGAGTGKTTVITRRIAYIIEKKLAKPSEILALTFTEKAAGEMDERVDILVPLGFTDTTIATFNAFGDQILREKALEIGLTPDFRVLTRPEQVLFIQDHLFSFDLNYYRPLSNPHKFIDAMITLISRAKDEDVSPEKYLQFAKNIQDKEEQKRQEELANFYLKYEQLKIEAGFIDFADQIALTLKMFRQKPKVLGQFQQKYKYILVDEFQDTNYSQNLLVKLLSQKYKNICVVGDDDQAIYKFRGAAISNILEFKKNYPKVKQVVLTQNYRSTQPILDCAYTLISHNNPDRLEVRNKINKKLKSAKTRTGAAPPILFGETLSEETDLVVKEIESLRNTNNYQYKDFAVLLRANSSAEAFIQAFNLNGIPHQFVGSYGLYDLPEIKELIAFLKSLTTFDDDLNLYYLATSDLYNVPAEDLIKIADFSKRRNTSLDAFLKSKIYNQLQIDKTSKEKIESLMSDQQKYIIASRKKPIGNLLYDFLEEKNILKDLKKKDTPQSLEKIANIAKFFDRITEFSKVAKDNSVRNFSNYLEIMRASGENPATAQLDPDLNSVNIMTVHSAKGLEFPIIFLGNLVAEKFPVRDRSEPIPLPTELVNETLPIGDFHLQEERRLFYVGLTRAKDFLYLTYARDYGGKKLRKVSPFVLETLDTQQVPGMPVKSSAIEKIERFADKSGQLMIDFENQRIVTTQRIINLSRMDIESYLSCALQYWYGRVARLQVPRNYNIVYGTALHKAVEHFFIQKMSGKIIPLPQLLDLLEEAWVVEGFLTPEHEKLSLIKAKNVISDFWKREKDKSHEQAIVEKTFRFTHEKVIVRGRIDYIEQGEKTVVLDFKSTEGIDEKKAKERVRQSIQLKIYALAYKKLYGKIPEEIGLYFLDNGIISTAKVTEAALNEAAHAIEATAAGVRAGNFKANPKDAFTCRYCSFNRICPSSLV